MGWWQETIEKVRQQLALEDKPAGKDSLDDDRPGFTPDVRAGVRMYCAKMESPLQRVSRLYKRK